MASHVQPVLKVESLAKNFGGVIALRDANFELLPGEIHALMGENGAGKSTFIKILSGLYSRDGGSILIDGKELLLNSPTTTRNNGIAVIYQEFDLFPNLSIADNLLLGREPTRLFGFVKDGMHKRLAADYLEQVGLNINPELLCGDLPASKRQLIAIATALSENARILIMDEPTSTLARDEIDKLLQLITRLRGKGSSIIYVSHKLDEVFSIADRVTVFRDGRTIGTRENPTTSPKEIVTMMVGRDMETLYTKSGRAGDEVLLQVNGLRKNGVFNAIDFSLKRGEILGFYGLKGAGRSEIMKVLFGLEPSDGGKVVLTGKSVRIRSPRDAIDNGIGFVPEDRNVDGLFPNMSVLENMSISAMDKLNKYGFIERRKERNTVHEYISDMNIRMIDVKQQISGLSGGNQQKVLLARWLINNPSVLILDEPTAGIDVGARYEIYRLIDQLAARGMGIILISSDLPEILGMADRILVMYGCSIVAEFLREEATEEKILQTSLPVQASAVRRYAGKVNLPPEATDHTRV